MRGTRRSTAMLLVGKALHRPGSRCRGLDRNGVGRTHRRRAGFRTTASPACPPLRGVRPPNAGTRRSLARTRIREVPLLFRHLAAAFLPLAAVAAGVLAVGLAVQVPTGPSSAVGVPSVMLPGQPAPEVLAPPARAPRVPGQEHAPARPRKRCPSRRRPRPPRSNRPRRSLRRPRPQTPSPASTVRSQPSLPRPATKPVPRGRRGADDAACRSHNSGPSAVPVTPPRSRPVGAGAHVNTAHARARERRPTTWCR